MTTRFSDQLDTELMISRRAFPVAQALLSGPVLRLVAEAAEIGWHGSQTHPETGSVALVREDGPYVDLVGQIVRIERPVPTEPREVFAYVFATAPILGDISLARRTFMGLGILANESIEGSIGIVA